MTVDASHLVWPPFESLYDQIERIKLDPAAVDVHRLQTELQKYIPWLRRGLHTFRPPSDSSRKAIEGETRLTFGAETGSGGALEVTPHLRSVALALSTALNLDEIQTVVLVHRCPMGGQGESPPDGLGSDSVVLPGGYVNVHYATKIARVYEQERLFLLQSIESLLWLGEGAIENAVEQGDCLQTVKDALDQLLMDVNGDVSARSTSKNAMSESSSLEDVTFRCLRENLDQKIFLLPEAVEIDIQSDVQSLYSKCPTGLRDMTGSAAMERNVLIIILAIIYYHPRKQCTPERFVELARTFNSGLFSEEAASRDQASILSCHLATLLLLQVLSLDVHKVVECVGQGKPLGPESFAFLSAPVRAAVDKEFGSKEWSESILKIRANDEQASESLFQADAMPVHATVLLTWAALLTLGGDGGGGGMVEGAAQRYAALATQGNALAGLAALASTPGLRHVSSEWAATVVFSAMTTILIAYQLDVHTFLTDQGQHVVDALCGVYEGHPSLCDAFWESGTDNGGGVVVALNQDASSRSVHQPVLMVLRTLESIFPALPIPLLRLLTSLASSSRSALAARQYFSSMFTVTSSPPTLSCVHELPDPHIACNGQYDDQGGGEYDYGVGTSVVLRSPIILPGTGDVLAIPPLFYTKEQQGLNVSGGSILQVDWPPPSTTTMTTERRATQVIIQWRIDDEMPLGFGFWVIMSRTWQKLDLFSTTTDQELYASLTEVETVMGFFSTLCRRDASAPLALITIGTATDGAPCTMCSSRNYLQNAGAPGTVDCLTLVSKTLVAVSRVLSHRNQPRGAMIRGLGWKIVSHCCRIAAAFIPVAGSRRVMVDTVQIFMGGFHGVSQSNQPTLGSAMVQDLDAFLDCCTAANSFVKLLTELVHFRGEKRGAQDNVLDVVLEWVIARLFPGIRNLLAPYTLKRRNIHTHRRLNGGGSTKTASVRWQIASSAISLLRSSILHYRYPSSPVALALSMRTGLSTWLFPLLPLNAHDLEYIAQDGQRAEEVEAVEACCISWLRLLPDLLHWLTRCSSTLTGSAGSAGSACEAYCRPTTRRGKDITPATVLLSYISYRYFAVPEQTLVMKALYAVSEAVGHFVPDLPLGSLLPEKAGQHILDALRGCAKGVSSNLSNLDELFAASCQVLISAIQHHPSLTETIFTTNDEASSLIHLIWSLITANSKTGESDGGKDLHQAISLTVVAAAAGSGSREAPRAKFISRVPFLLWCQKEDFWSVVTSIVKRAANRQQRIEEESQAEVMAEVAALQIVFRLGPRQVVEDEIIPLLPALLDRYSSPVGLNTLIESGVILMRSAAALGFTLLETTTTDLGLISPSSLPSLSQLSSLTRLHLADGGQEDGPSNGCGCKDTVYRLAEAWYRLCQHSTDPHAAAGQLDSAMANIILTAMDVDDGELEVLSSRLDAVDAFLTLPVSLTSRNGQGTQGKARQLQKLLRCIEPSLDTGSKGTHAGSTQLGDLWKCFQDREAAAWLTHTQLLAVKTLDDIVSSVYLSHQDATLCTMNQLLEGRTKVLSVLLATVQAASHQLVAFKGTGEAKAPSALQIGIDAHVAMASHIARVALLVCNYRQDKNDEIATETETFGQAVVACEATAMWLEGVLNANDQVVRQCNKHLADVASILLTLALQFIEKCASAGQGGTSSSRSTLPAKTMKRLFEAVSSFIAGTIASTSVVNETWMALRESGVAALSLATSLIRNRPQIAKLDGQYVATVFSRLHIDLHFAEIVRRAHNNRPDGVAASHSMTLSTKNIDADNNYVDSGSGGSQRELEELEAWLLLVTQTISSFPEEGPRAFGLEDIMETVLSMGAQRSLGELEPRVWRAVLELVAAAVRASPYYPNDPSSTSMDATSSLYAYGQQSHSMARGKLAVWAAVAWHDRLVQGCCGSTTFEWFNEGIVDKSEKVEDVVSLESLQETRLCLFLACEAARDIGTWRLSLPFAIPVLRSSTTKLLKDASSLLSEIKEEASLEWRVLAYACVADALRFQLAVTPQVQATDSTSIQHTVPDLLKLQTLCIDRLVGPGQLLSLVQGPELQSGGGGRADLANIMRVMQSMTSILGASSRLLTLASVRSVPAAEDVMRQCVASNEAWESRE